MVSIACMLDFLTDGKIIILIETEMCISYIFILEKNALL